MSDAPAPVSQPQPLDPAHDGVAAALLAACPGGGTAAVAALRADPAASLYGRFDGDEPVAVYALRKVGLTTEVTHLAVAAAHRGRGHGRACLADALTLAGPRPLVAETDDAGLGFHRACGFKLVGKRRGPDGTTRYRMGAHAPRPAAGPQPLRLTAPRPAPATGAPAAPVALTEGTSR